MLGDIDADQVQVEAKTAAGLDVSAAQIDGWFKGGFNYAGTKALPRWDASSTTLLGAAGFADTVGASGWFEPHQALSSLTLTFTARTGFPTYQTWFAAAAHSLSGTVTGVATGGGSCTLSDATLTLLAADGTELAQRHPNAAGGYTFGQLAEAGYVVRLDPPPTCTITSPAEQPVDTAAGDDVADFVVRHIEGLQISGSVTAAGQPVAGVTVSLTPTGGGTTRVTTTADDGTYLFDQLNSGTYTAVISELPDGYVPAGTTSRTVVVTPPNNSTGEDFILTQYPPLSGTVTGGGGPLGGVTVTLTPTTGGASFTTATLGDGTYTFDHVLPGTYTVAVEAPPGYRPAPIRAGVLVTGTPVTGQDFNLTRPAALGGSATTPTGAPIGGALITITGPNITTMTIASTADGRFHVEGLPPGTYSVTITPPPGYRTLGSATRRITLVDGQLIDTLHFSLQATPAITPSPPNQPHAAATLPPATGSTGGLANTGTPTTVEAILAGSLITGGAYLLIAGRRRPANE